MNLKESFTTWLRLLETLKTDLNSTILLDLKGISYKGRGGESFEPHEFFVRIFLGQYVNIF